MTIHSRTISGKVFIELMEGIFGNRMAGPEDVSYEQCKELISVLSRMYYTDEKDIEHDNILLPPIGYLYSYFSQGQDYKAQSSEVAQVANVMCALGIKPVLPFRFPSEMPAYFSDSETLRKKGYPNGISFLPPDHLGLRMSRIIRTIGYLRPYLDCGLLAVRIVPINEEYSDRNEIDKFMYKYLRRVERIISPSKTMHPAASVVCSAVKRLFATTAGTGGLLAITPRGLSTYQEKVTYGVWLEEALGDYYDERDELLNWSASHGDEESVRYLSACQKAYYDRIMPTSNQISKERQVLLTPVVDLIANTNPSILSEEILRRPYIVKEMREGLLNQLEIALSVSDESELQLLMERVRRECIDAPIAELRKRIIENRLSLRTRAVEASVSIITVWLTSFAITGTAIGRHSILAAGGAAVAAFTGLILHAIRSRSQLQRLPGAFLLRLGKKQ